MKRVQKIKKFNFRKISRSDAIRITPKQCIVGKNVRKKGHIKIEFYWDLVYDFSLYNNLFAGYCNCNYWLAQALYSAVPRPNT